jgi:integrase
LAGCRRGEVESTRAATGSLNRKEFFMSKADKHVVVWVQKFKDRESLMLQWNDPDTGKRKSVSAGTNYKPMAEAKARELEYELNHGLHKDASRMTWENFREAFENEYVAGKRLNTRLGYQATFDLFERLCCLTSIRAISNRTLSGFLAAMRREPTRGRDGIMASTMSTHLQHLRTALRWAVDQELLPKCPKFPKVEMDQKLPRPVPVESFERIYAKAEGDQQMQAYLLCGWLAGLRLSEALCLEWEETEEAAYVDLARNRIILPAKTVKGKKDQWVPLDPVLREALLALPRHGKKVFRFISQRTSLPAGTRLMTGRVINLAKLAGVRLSMHTLRKGFGCRYAGRVPARVLQKLMRHWNIKTTMDYYVNVDEAVEEAVLGPQRNSLRNTTKDTSEAVGKHDSITNGQEGTSDRSQDS